MTKPWPGLSALLLCAASVSAQTPQGTSFTHQGRLTENSNPANGTYDFEFRLFDSPSAGIQVGPLVTRGDVVAANGLFTTLLDFGAVFAGNKRWLEIAVRPGASTGAYTTVSPRQELTSAPASLFSAQAPWAGVSGKPAGFADDVDNDSLGTVTSVTAGSGLSGGTITSSGTIAVDFAGSGTATTPARSDHNHLGQTWTGATGMSAGLRVESTTAVGLFGGASAAGADGVRGQTSAGDAAGVAGINTSTAGFGGGVYGQSSSTETGGVGGANLATTGFAFGVGGRSSSSSGPGVFGNASAATGIAAGVHGSAASTSGRGVYGRASATTGPTQGVRGETFSSQGTGVYGVANTGTGFTSGVYGQSNSSDGNGVMGVATATSGFAAGVQGDTSGPAGTGVRGNSFSTIGFAPGVAGRTNSISGPAVFGHALATTGFTNGVDARTDSNQGNGVYGEASSTTGNTNGVFGRTNSSNGNGVSGYSAATAGFAAGVHGQTDSTSGVGVRGVASTTIGFVPGVEGRSASTSGPAISGVSTATSGNAFGVWAESASPTGEAGHFSGNVVVTGTLSKGGGSFKIDHPLDPENKYLYHSFVESPDMMNIYNGNVTTDADGFAQVELPDWFEALNRDFRYQLTVVGDGLWARARVFRKVADGRFTIQTDLPGQEVSWQVTGIRKDPFAEAHRIPVEQAKPDSEQGRYLHPLEWDQPREKGVDWNRSHPDTAPSGEETP